MFDVVVVGSANLDLVARTLRHPAPGETVLGDAYAEHAGGKGLNQAVAAARSGARVAFVGAVGDDAAGTRLRGVLHDDGIDAERVTDVDAPTGRAVIVVDHHGENSIVVVPGANALVVLDTAPPPSSVLLAQLEIPIATVLDAFRQARTAGATTVLNPAPATALSPNLLAECDVVVPNQHEVELLGGVDALIGNGAKAVVVTRGGDGVDVHTSSGVTHVGTPTVDVVDTTGAGDAFCGSLAARLATGADLLDAVRWAAVAGALATTKPGAVPSQPRASDIEALLAASN